MVQSVLLSGVTVVGAITPAPVHPRKHGLPGCGSVGLPRVFLAFSLDLIQARAALSMK